MTPIQLFVYIVAAGIGLAMVAVILGAVFVFGGALLRRFSRGG